MKRCFYWYVYELFGRDNNQRFEAIVYGNKEQLLAYLKDSDWNYCLCSKAVARTLSHDIGIPIEDISNLEVLK